MSTWELRHQLTHILLLLRLPFLLAGCVLGGCCGGSRGGSTATWAAILRSRSTAFLPRCSRPALRRTPRCWPRWGSMAASTPASAWPTPCRDRGANGVRAWCCSPWPSAWRRPRTLRRCRWWRCWGWRCMLWVAEGRRSQVLPVVLAAMAGALVLLFACYGFSPDAFSYVFRSAAGFLWFSSTRRGASSPRCPMPASRWPPAPRWCCIWDCGRSRYFGNTAPLLCALVLMLLVMTGAPGSPWLWALPFLLTFVGGVFADAYEGPRGRLAMAAGGAIVLLAGGFCRAELAWVAVERTCRERSGNRW